MSLRTFTVFQDAASSQPSQPKIARPNVMATRSSTLNVVAPAVATHGADPLDKENYHPVTGERAGPSNPITKKRKTSVLATKLQPPTEVKAKKEKDSQPESKKRKASTSSTATKSKSTKKDAKVSGSTRKTSKRAGSKRVSPLPSLNEEEEVEKGNLSQPEIDSRCYELTVKPLADVSEAYDDLGVFSDQPATADVSAQKVKFRTVKASSAEPEIRDYFEPSQALFSSTSSRLRALSEDAPEPRAFSTPERKQIYAAFTFSSPSGSSARLSKASGSGDISPAEQLA